ncbi:MAG: lamin tail domain-containing protein [Flavobacteriaceae bacterium]
MKYLIHLFITFLFISCAKENSGNNNKGKGIIINEFLASNDACCSDSFGDFDDWVELYNDSEEAVDIGGMFFTDTPGDDNPYLIPKSDPSSTTIPAKGFLLLWCDDDQEQGVLHLSKKLKGSGESIILYQADGSTVVDSIRYDQQTTDRSMGRNIDNLDEWIFYDNPTPGSENRVNQ